jgi:hypothetical protein
LFRPAQYLPLHVDLFGRYREVNNLTNEQVVRTMVMLEDSVPGQILQVDGETFGDWKAGDTFSWQEEDLHALYNFSMSNRYAVQVTATIREG